MSNSGHFKGGYDPRRNLDGRPVGSGKDIRVDATYDMVKTHAPIAEKVLMDIALKAEQGHEGWQKWYLERLIPLLYSKAKTDIEIGHNINAEGASDLIATLPKKKLLAIQEILLEKESSDEQ